MIEAERDPLDRNEIADRLYLVAVQSALGSGRAFHKEADSELRQRISVAAEEVLRPSILGNESLTRATLPLDVRMNEAERAVRRLVHLMVEHAESISGYAPNVLGEQTLAGASVGFCPCWPFC